ncbi:MAG: fatty acid-binding protein DegV, partial [Oscillospiraceae bacterium]
MRTVKIVADSSANIISLDGVSFASAPLKVITDNREFVDDTNSSAEEMIEYFQSYKGRSKTSCP